MARSGPCRCALPAPRDGRLCRQSGVRGLPIRRSSKTGSRADIARREKNASVVTCRRLPTEERRSYVCLGGHEPALIRSGVTMACRRDGEAPVVTATNHATGHNFPGERHNRVLYLQVIERSRAGEITLARQELIKGITPFRGESSAEKLRVAEPLEARFPVVGPPVAAEVQLLYKSFPWYPDRDVLVAPAKRSSWSSNERCRAATARPTDEDKRSKPGFSSVKPLDQGSFGLPQPVAGCRTPLADLHGFAFGGSDRSRFARTLFASATSGR